jgi:hypothetical protein
MPTEPGSSYSQQRRWPAFNRMAMVNALVKWVGARPADARSYILLFVAVVIPPILIMLVLALTQEPLRGDLTRPGGYTESDYGWNKPQERFSPPLVSTRYDRPFDVVVLGDSFSANLRGQTDAGAFWPNYLAQRTGLSTVVVTRFDMTLADLLRHPVFLRTPPRVLILETVERYLIRDFVHEADQRVGRSEGHCGVEVHRLPALPAFRALNTTPVPWVRDTRPEVNFDQAANFLWKTVLRNGLGYEPTRVLRLALTRSDMFSSRRSDQLLVYDDELRKMRIVTTEALDQAYCALIDAQNRIQRNGHTRFLFMSAPDKATAYADYLTDAELRHISPLPEFYRRSGLKQVALVERLRQAIRCGAKDIYMPNDTHWSSTGHGIVADAVIAALTGAQDRPSC